MFIWIDLYRLVNASMKNNRIPYVLHLSFFDDKYSRKNFIIVISFLSVTRITQFPWKFFIVRISWYLTSRRAEFWLTRHSNLRVGENSFQRSYSYRYFSREASNNSFRMITIVLMFHCQHHGLRRLRRSKLSSFVCLIRTIVVLSRPFVSG